MTGISAQDFLQAMFHPWILNTHFNMYFKYFSQSISNIIVPVIWLVCCRHFPDGWSHTMLIGTSNVQMTIMNAGDNVNRVLHSIQFNCPVQSSVSLRVVQPDSGRLRTDNEHGGVHVSDSLHFAWNDKHLINKRPLQISGKVAVG